jgi:hypothetical protein
VAFPCKSPNPLIEIADTPQNRPNQAGVPTPCPGLEMLHTVATRSPNESGDELSDKRERRYR